MNTALLADQLTRHEGLRLSAYRDSLGYLTIGIGRMIDGRLGGGITAAEARYLLQNDIDKVCRELDTKLPWWRQQDDVRMRALADLCFNLGIKKLLLFKNTLRAWEARRYEEAAKGLRASKWYGQVKIRGPRIVHMVRTGTDPQEV